MTNSLQQADELARPTSSLGVSPPEKSVMAKWIASDTGVVARLSKFEPLAGHCISVPGSSMSTVSEDALRPIQDA